MQRLCNKLRTLTLSSSRRLLFQSHAPIHRLFHSAPSSKWRLSPLFNYPSSSSSHITRCCSYPSPSLASAPSLCSSRLPLSFIQVRHVSSRDRKKRRKPVTPVTSKVKKIKMKSYSSYKSRFRTMNDGQVRRWHEGKRHNAHLKSKKSKRRLRQPALVPLAYAKVMKTKKKKKEAMFFASIFLPPPVSLSLNIISVGMVVFAASLGYSEIKGKHMKYSKFWNFNSRSIKSAKKKEINISSKIGMLLFYTPSFFAGLASLWLCPFEGFRFRLLTSALTFHFFKRIFEVLFIHKYSGGMVLDSAIVVSLGYVITTTTMIYIQRLSQREELILDQPTIDLKFVGIILFCLGISGNFYHHYLLSRMRRNGEKEYRIPTGGLFDKVVCPHYLFELIEFWGIFFISQTLYAFCNALGVTFYLMGRSYITRTWYLSKFEHFPKHVKALFPYIF